MASNSGAVAQSIPTSVPKSTRVQIEDAPQRVPREAPKGKTLVKAVPNSGSPETAPQQPGYGTGVTIGGMPEIRLPGAPSVPELGGSQFRSGEIDVHYQNTEQSVDPYSKVNNPPTRGMFTWVKTYANMVFNGVQNVDSAGHQQNSPQQRTSYSRITLPPVANGYDPQMSAPHALPQTAYTQRFLPTTGSDPYGSGVLNSDNYGAGQISAAEGGQQYSPTPGPPATTSTADQPSSDSSGMRTWG